MNNNKMKKITKRELKQQNNAKGLLLGSSILCGWFALAPTVQASDVEIYRQGTTGGNSTIMLMVDTSQTMGSPALDILKDYPLCISSKIFGVVGALPVVNVKLTPPAGKEVYCDVVFPKSILDLLGTVDTLTGKDRNSLLGLQNSLDYMRSSCTPFSKLPATEEQPDNRLKLELNLGEGYRCYSRLSRIRMAVQDVLDGNKDKGIEALSVNATVGLSVFPAKNSNGVNQKAGMIVIPAQKLDDAQRTALKSAMNNLFPSSDPLGTTLDKVVGILSHVIDKLDILGLVNDVLGLVGSLPATVTALLATPETSTATAYAETGAYLLGQNTRGTGERLSEFEVPVKDQSVAYKCLARQANQDCTQYEKAGNNPKTYAVPTGYLRTEQVTPSNGLLGDLLSNLLGALFGGGNKSVIRYYYADDAVYSGYAYRASTVPMKNDNYDNPEPIKKVIGGTSTSQCEAQGIFVLTGNTPQLNAGDASLGVQRVMQKSLGKNPTTAISDFCGAINSGSASATWSCINSYSQALLDKNTNYRTHVEIKTGVAGIGKEYNYVRVEDNKIVGVGTDGSIVNDLLNGVKGLLNTALGLLKLVGVDLSPLTNLVNIILPTSPANPTDISNLAKWGVDGKGGWYTEASTGGMAQSILNFSKHIVDAQSDAFMGLQNIPADPLTPYQLSNDVYNSIFTPADQQSWNGNLKKYSVTDSGNGNNIIRMVDWKDQWSNPVETEAKDGSTLFTGGMLKQLKALRLTKTDDSTRKLWINRNCKKDGTFAESENLKAITKAYASDISVERCTDNSSAKDNRQYETGYLMNLLGYKIDPENFLTTQLDQSEPLWQIGMSLHSTPFKITQNATFQSNGSIDRNDYIVFGSTQGLLHVVNASDGKEKFAFVPNEMLENAEQRKAFTSERKGNWRNMLYGIDGAWTAYTEYAYGMDSNGKIYATVGEAKNKQGSVIATGKQVVYGGLRMGGRSYYALDLANLDNPILKFHINPVGECSTTNPLGCMGQSWSKPTIAYVNWRGVRTRVMFVGGGYDVGYEAKDYNQGNSVGAGVYMFSTDDIKGKDEKGEEITKVKAGELLWWASSKADSKNDGNKEHSLNVLHMNYSVVSRINTVDRNGDGLVDHLYFGDLGGQVWRIDINTQTATGSFAQRATRILNLHQENGGSPRFYDAPNFSIYGYEKPLAVVSIASGNRSLPASDPSSGAIYNIFDRDVTKNNLYTLNENDLETKDIDLSTANHALRAILRSDEAKDKNVEQVKASMPNGWVVSFDPNAAVGKDVNAGKGKKIMDEMAVINKNLYASVYDPGETPSCPVQVRGVTQVHRYCLPFGVCEQVLQSENQTDHFIAGKGIVALNVGSGAVNNGKLQSRALINLQGDNSEKVIPMNNQMRRQLVPLTWYERNE